MRLYHSSSRPRPRPFWALAPRALLVALAVAGGMNVVVFLGLLATLEPPW